MTENEVNIYSIAYRDCKEVSDSIDVNEEVGKESTILFYMDEILEALKIASELQAIGTIEEFKYLKLKEHNYDNCHNYTCKTKCEKDGYNKAIDEFVSRLEKHEQENWVDHHEYGITWSDIKLIAEQMKGGV